MNHQQVQAELASLADPERAKSSAWFFKTGKGEYGEGDRFLGVRVPQQRAVARRFILLPLAEVKRLLASPVHEHRFTAAEILVAKYELASDAADKQKIFDFYLKNAVHLNNWDLVDTSAPYIVGEHLKTRPRASLYSLAASANVWERRIAIVSTLAFVKARQIDDTLKIAELLLADKHDLIRKAVGWALRESGRVSRPHLLAFIEEHYQALSRTTLRYAIEHFPADERKSILKGKFLETG